VGNGAVVSVKRIRCINDAQKRGIATLREAMKDLGISFYRGTVEKTFEEIRNQCLKNNIQLYLDIELENKMIVPIEIIGNSQLKELIV
jgi:hypothetical protein